MEIGKVQKYGKAYFSGNLGAKFLKNNLSQTRIGFAVGIKFSKKASERNQMKRWMREIFRQELPRIKNGEDIIVLARRQENEKIKPEKLKIDAKKILQEAGLLISLN